MDEKPSKLTAKQRASYARAARLRRVAGQDGAQKTKAGSAARAADRQQAATKRTRGMGPAARRQGQGTMRERVERLRLEKKVERARKEFAQAVDRRRDQAGRAAFNQQQADLKKRLRSAAEKKRHQALKDQQRRSERNRQEFNRKAAERRVDAHQVAQRRREQLLADVARRARAEIEAAHKRQRDEQQQAHRRETDQTRKRHTMERDSFRSNELAAAERHAGAIKRLDAAELRALDQLAVRHASLQGRIASLKPGAKAARETARTAIRDRYEADRLKAHRDQEAYKERQFTREQNTRLQHARERLVGMGAHREQRDNLQVRQETERPRLIEQRQHALIASPGQARDRWRPNDLTSAFNRSR